MDEYWQKVAKVFLMSVIYSFLKYECYRQTHTSSGNVRNTQLLFGPPRRNPFFDPSPPLFAFRTIPCEPLG